MMDVPPGGALVAVTVVSGVHLKREGSTRQNEIFVKVGLDTQSATLHQTQKLLYEAAAVHWDETLPDMVMLLGSRYIVLEVMEVEPQRSDLLIGRGKLDLRLPRNTVHAVSIMNSQGREQGRLMVKFAARPPADPS